MTGGQRGQSLVAAAALLPLLLVPVSLYAVEVSLLAARQARLAGAVARAAEDAAQQVDVDRYRQSGSVELNPVAAALVAASSLAGSDPAAVLESTARIGADGFAVSAREDVALEVGFLWPGAAVTLRSTAGARLRTGFDPVSAPNR